MRQCQGDGQGQGVQSLAVHIKECEFILSVLQGLKQES